MSTRDEFEAEQWRPIPGWEDLYRVSDQGRVFSVRSNRLLKPYPAPNDYLLVTLYRRGEQKRLVHQLVAEAFISPRPAGQQVRHGPGGQQDNRRANLCYGTPSENMADQVRDGTNAAGSRNGFARLTEAVVMECRQRYANGGETYASLAAEFGVDFTTIALAVKGKTWQHVTTPVTERARPEDRACCPRRHEYTPENTYTTPRGHRRCRQCKRDRGRVITA